MTLYFALSHVLRILGFLEKLTPSLTKLKPTIPYGLFLDIFEGKNAYSDLENGEEDLEYRSKSSGEIQNPVLKFLNFSGNLTRRITQGFTQTKMGLKDTYTGI